MNQYIAAQSAAFDKSVEHFRKEIATLRTGRANPAILEGITVETYGSRTPLNGVAAISVPDAQSITVAPWDKGVLKDIERAITEADLGLGMVNEGARLRLTMPKMTEENRHELVKRLNEKQEAARVAIRQTREEVKESIEKAAKDKAFPEDDKFRFLKELDAEVARYNDELKEIRDRKEKDIMTI